MLVRTSSRRILFILLSAALALGACNVGATPAPTIDANAINTAAFGTAVAQIAAQQTQTALAAPSNTPAPTNTVASLTTAAAGLPTTSGALPTSNSGALPTVSFNITPNTTPLAGFTPLAGSPVAPAGPTTSLGDACNNNTFVADVTIPDGTIFGDDKGRGSRPGDEFHKVWRVQNTGSCKWDEGYQLAFIGGDDELDPHSVVFDSADDFVDPGENADLGITLVAPKFPGKYTATWRMQTDSGQYFGTPLTVLIEVIE
jgi:hypothetical protein